MGFHQITLSTAGLIPQIRQITGEGLQFQLAVSLHAADDELRNRLVPINRKYPLDQLISACKEYQGKQAGIFLSNTLFSTESTIRYKALMRLLLCWMVLNVQST